MDASESIVRDSRQSPKENGKVIFQPQMDESHFSGRDQELRTYTLVRHRPIQGESNIDFLVESEGFSSITSRLISGCR